MLILMSLLGIGSQLALETNATRSADPVDDKNVTGNPRYWYWWLVFINSGISMRYYRWLSPLGYWPQFLSTSVQNYSRQSISKGLKQLSLSYWGMQLGHLGLAVTAIGIALVSSEGIEKDVRMQAGDSLQVQEYRFSILTARNKYRDQITAQIRGRFKFLSKKRLLGY